MIPDKIDIFIMDKIFQSFKDKKEITNWDIAKEYAKLVNEPDENKVFCRIKARLDQYCCYGHFKKILNNNGSRRYIYEMDLNKITFVKHKFSDGFKKCLLIRVD